MKEQVRTSAGIPDDGFPPRGSGIPRAREKMPSAVWANPDMLGDNWTWRPGHVFLGKWGDRLIGYRDDRHMVTVAGSRAGKSSTVLIPNLKTYPGSVLVMDPKGELAKATAEHRDQTLKQNVFILDPFGASGYESAHHNPLEELAAAPPGQIVADAALFADALIIGHQKDPYWTDAARNLLRGLVLYLLWTNPDSAAFRQITNWLHSESLEDLFEAMKECPAFDGIVANVGSSFLGRLRATPKELQTILSTAIEQTARLADIDKITHRSDFHFRHLKQAPTTVYLVLPGMRMGTHSRWLRLLIQQALAAMEATKSKSDLPVLFILEEFATLGYMQTIESAAGFLAGFGVKMWSVLQDFTQLKTHYPNSWETFLGNAGIVQAFGNADLTTTEHLSKMMGQTVVNETQVVHASSASQASGDTGVREHIRHVSLLAPNEITQFFARERMRQLILSPRLPPIYMQRVSYAEEF